MKQPYAELFCRSNFSFQHGASHPEELVQTACELGYNALAITDECSLAGVVRAHGGWRELGARQTPADGRTRFRLIIGACFRHDDSVLVLLAETKTGYAHLSQLITRCRIDAEKGSYHFDPSYLASVRECSAIIVPGKAPEALLVNTTALFRAIGYTRALTATDASRFEYALSIAATYELPLTACGDVLIHDKSRQPLQDILTAVRSKTSVERLGERAEQNAERSLRPLSAIAHLYPVELLLNSVLIAERCQFSLQELCYEYPREFIPDGLTPARFLRKLTLSGARRRYDGRMPGKVKALLRKEFRLVAEKSYEAYFLTVYDIVREARAMGILCQGRGSSANSAICFCLHITELDPGRCNLLFERFISRERDEPPDIDVDFEHERREEVIQYIFRKYGHHRAALCAAVVSYRTKGAVRDVGKALGFSEDQLDRISQNLSWWDKRNELAERLGELGFDAESPRVQQLLRHADELRGKDTQDDRDVLRGFPRHLSQHPGGFVLAHGRLDTQVPIENATMPNRRVVQWDKDDIEELGMMKVDVLGLGMLSCLRRSMALVSELLGRPLAMQDIPKEDGAVYDMLCRGESTGVFQIESRAQMNMLPRLRPRNYFDLVVQIAIVRPGPIQGGMVHPYLRRRQQIEPVDYPSAAVESVLKRTLGIPIFQEQVMELSMKAAGFTAGEADQLRRSMAAWKRKGGLGHLKDKLINGMLERGYTLEFAMSIYEQIKGFGSYGFPESHAASFALLAYNSAWVKCHYPAAFCCALLNSQPMGFYSPSQLVQDARRNGVTVLPVDINESDWDCALIYDHPDPAQRTPARTAVRLGLRMVTGLGEAVGLELVRQRKLARFSSIRDVVQRSGINEKVIRALAAADAFKPLAGDRMQSMWMAAASKRPDLPLAPTADDNAPVPLTALTLGQEVIADYRSTGLSLRVHPLRLLRGLLAGTRQASTLAEIDHGRHIRVAGLVTCRQRPGTASGVTFVTLEDETGNTNVIVWRKLAEKERRALLASRLMIVHGKLEHQGPITHLVAAHMEDASHLLAGLMVPSHDFH